MALYRSKDKRDIEAKNKKEFSEINDLSNSPSEKIELTHDGFVHTPTINSSMIWQPINLKISSLIKCDTNPPFPKAHGGDGYLAITPGKFGTYDANIGDTFLCLADTEESQSASYEKLWMHFPKNIITSSDLSIPSQLHVKNEKKMHLKQQNMIFKKSTTNLVDFGTFQSNITITNLIVKNVGPYMTIHSITINLGDTVIYTTNHIVFDNVTVKLPIYYKYTSGDKLSNLSISIDGDISEYEIYLEYICDTKAEFGYILESDIAEISDTLEFEIPNDASIILNDIVIIPFEPYEENSIVCDIMNGDNIITSKRLETTMHHYNIIPAYSKLSNSTLSINMRNYTTGKSKVYLNYSVDFSNK